MRFLLTLTLAAVFAIPAAAADKPAPGCAGSYADDRADWGGSTVGEPQNLDITEFWFDVAGDTVTANLRVAELTAEPTENTSRALWRVRWQAGDTEWYVESSSSGQPFFYWGEVVNGYTRRGRATGEFFPGADGVIRWTIPAAAGGVVGAELRSPLAETLQVVNDSGVTMMGGVDTASGRLYTASRCSAAPSPGDPPAPQPQPSPQPQPQPEAAATLDVTAPKSVRVARRGTRTLTLRLRSETGVRSVSALLTRRGRRVAVGQLPTLGHSDWLRLGAPTGRKLRRGTYRLTLTGVTAEGRSASKTVTLRLR